MIFRRQFTYNLFQAKQSSISKLGLPKDKSNWKDANGKLPAFVKFGVVNFFRFYAPYFIYFQLILNSFGSGTAHSQMEMELLRIGRLKATCLMLASIQKA